MGRKVVDLTGKKFNMLKVLKLAYIKDKKVCYWLCECDCGNRKIINGNDIKSGNTKACGCQKGKLTKYKIQNKKLYKKWQHMKDRCYKEKDVSYKNYGARGIKVCEEWKDFDNFAKWSLNNGYSEELELDRIDPNKGYYPSNCRYITKLENIRNRRITLKYDYNGEVLTLKELATKYNIPYKTLWARIRKYKMTAKQAIEFTK